MADKLLAEFPETTYEQWREQVDKDLKGADFQKRLITRTLEGLEVQPLYTAKNLAGRADPGFAGLPPYRRGGTPIGRYGARWDLRSEHCVWDSGRAREEIAADLARGATSAWLRFEDGALASPKLLEQLLGGVDLAKVAIALDAGPNAAEVATAYLKLAAERGIDGKALTGSLGFDPLGTLAQTGRLPYTLDAARSSLLELVKQTSKSAPKLRSVVVATTAYHDAGASAVQEIAVALATALTYLRWMLEGGLSIAAASAQLEFRVGVASDLFGELAKLRALRVGYAKLVAALGGDDASQNLQLHAVTARRTKTVRDPWVNMLRTTTEAFSAMAGGADALTTRGFDEAVGPSDAFARRIARNVQVILNEEAHVTHVADPGGGSYYIESLTDTLARDAWKKLQQLEAGGGIAKALEAGTIQAEIAELADKRDKAIAKRALPITGVSEFANVTEEPLAREKAARPVTADATKAAVTVQALPLRRHAERFEALRARAEAHAKKTGQPPAAFLANLGSIPQHKARAGFTTGFLNAGGIVAIENDGFSEPDALVQAFQKSGSKLAVICGGDDQYPEWVPKVAPALAKAGAVEVLVAGRPGEHEAAFKAAGVTGFIFVGADVASALASLLDRSGVAS